ncbi:MAG: cytidylate kinase-like family protein [Desulfobacter sp.]|nr:cytidylate kinase-like family protein [Desulfobacter sp.]
MTNDRLNTKYKPGAYGKKRLSAAAWADANIKKWDNRSTPDIPVKQDQDIFPCICFSRQIGLGALKIADYLSKALPYRVVDREILEYMAKEKNLSEKAIAFFDERYPGKMSELFSMLISEKTFLKSDYARQLARTVTVLAGTEPTIFVGRGTHLILPRKRVLAVSLVSGTDYRIDRLARIINVSRTEAENQLKVLDKEQKQYFKSVFNTEGNDPKDFDLVISRDHIRDARQATRIIACAFEQKFNPE